MGFASDSCRDVNDQTSRTHTAAPRGWRGSSSSRLISPAIEYSCPSHLPPCLRSGWRFIEVVFSLGKNGPDCTSKGCWSLRNSSSKRWTGGKCKQALFLLANLGSESKSISGIVPFGMRRSQCIRDRERGLCSVICKLSRRGCWFLFLPPPPSKFFPCCQAYRQWKPACRKLEILASVRTSKSSWRFWQRERRVHRQQKMA